MIHNAPRGNTDKRRGGPVGPYAIGAHTPQHEYPATPIPHNKDIRTATDDEVRHYKTVQGRNVTYLTMPAFLSSLKRIAYNEGKATIWETDWIRNVLNLLYDSFCMVNENIPALRRYREIAHDRDKCAQVHINELRDYAFPQARNEGLISAAIELQRNIDNHKRLEESDKPINSCPETELRSHRRDLVNWYIPHDSRVDYHTRDERCELLQGGWTHHMHRSLTRHRYKHQYVYKPYQPDYPYGSGASSSGSSSRKRDQSYHDHWSRDKRSRRN